MKAPRQPAIRSRLTTNGRNVPSDSQMIKVATISDVDRVGLAHFSG